MEEKKNPRIPAWKVWILILSTTQVIGAIQNYQSHRLLWDAILQQDQIVTNHIEDCKEHSMESSQYMTELSHYLADLKQTLEMIRGKFQGQ